jgi:hypothetical protein
MKKYNHLSVVEITLLENMGFLVGKLLWNADLRSDKRYNGGYLNVYDCHFSTPIKDGEWQKALESEYLINPQRLYKLPKRTAPCRLLGTADVEHRDLEPKICLSVPHYHVQGNDNYPIIMSPKEYLFKDVKHLEGLGYSTMAFLRDVVSIEWVRKMGNDPKEFFENTEHMQDSWFQHAMLIVLSRPKYWETPPEIRGKLPY